MGFWGKVWAALPLAAATVLLSAMPAGSAGGGNPARDHVRAWQASMIARAFGEAAARESLDRPEIVGGTTAPSGAWPAQVALVYASIASNYEAQYCGGALIHARFVLTAAHCVDFLKSTSQAQVLAGTQSLKKGGTRHAIGAIHIHPRWNPGTSDFDVAVVELDVPVPVMRLNKVITQAQARRLMRPGRPAIVTGWGKLDENRDVYPTELQQADVPFVARSVCNAPQSYDGAITRRMVCAGFADARSDSCQGDSGGPLVLRHKRRLQAGIVSWGEGCARANFYGVYTDIASVRNWIAAIVPGL